MWAVMNAYQQVNGQYCAENPFLLTETLRKSWGFKGFVISDWGSTYSTAATINAGMNLEMPGGEPMRRWLAQPSTQENGNGAGWLTEEKVMAAIASGEVKQGDGGRQRPRHSARHVHRRPVRQAHVGRVESWTRLSRRRWPARRPPRAWSC